MLEVFIAPQSAKEDIWDLFQEYADELSQYDGEKRRRGVYHYPCFDLYWTQTNRFPFSIHYDHELIGFCFMQDTGVDYRIDEFYLRPVRRRRGFGLHAVERVKQHCRELGRHSILAANVYVNNKPAMEFWQKAGFRDTGRRTRVKDLRLVETEADL